MECVATLVSCDQKSLLCSIIQTAFPVDSLWWPHMIVRPPAHLWMDHPLRLTLLEKFSESNKKIADVLCCTTGSGGEKNQRKEAHHQDDLRIRGETPKNVCPETHCTLLTEMFSREPHI